MGSKAKECLLGAWQNHNRSVLCCSKEEGLGLRAKLGLPSRRLQAACFGYLPGALNCFLRQEPGLMVYLQQEEAITLANIDSYTHH